MASINFGPKLRPCMVNGVKHLFHCWGYDSYIVPPSILKGGHSGGVVANTFGIVEDEEGFVHKASVEKIVFLDNRIFDAYDFSVEEKEKNNAEN